MKNLDFRKYCLILIPLVLFSFNVFAQSGAWTKKAKIPNPRVVISAGVVDNKIYVIGGSSDGINSLDVNEVYDPLTDTWETKKLMPTARNFLSTAVVDGIIYTIGGNWNNDGSTTVEAYDPKTDTWSEKQTIPNPRFGASACVVDGIIYNVGGNHTKSYCDAYDPKTNSWAEKKAIPETEGGIMVTAYNGLIYAFGGGYEKCFSTLYAYNPVTDSLIKKKNMPTARATLQTCLVKDKIYALGGYYSINGGISTALEVYDPASDSWEKKTNMPVKRAMFAAAVVNDKIYLLGGTPDWISGGLEVWEYDLALDTTTTVEKELITPKEFTLYQNYPNPFNPTTNFAFRIANFGFVSLKVFDLLGRDAAMLVNEAKPAGNYEITWNAVNLPSGVYFYHLKVYPFTGGAGSYTATKKLLLLK